MIDRLAGDLGRAFPKMTGLSARNLKYMRAFAEAWPDGEFVQQVVALLPWGHNVRLRLRVETRDRRMPWPETDNLDASDLLLIL